MDEDGSITKSIKKPLRHIQYDRLKEDHEEDKQEIEMLDISAVQAIHGALYL
jgi:hypothetical protein